MNNNKSFAKEILINMAMLITDEETISSQAVSFFTTEMFSFEADMFLKLLDTPQFSLRVSDDEFNLLTLTEVKDCGIFKSDYIVNKYNHKFSLPSLKDILKVIEVNEVINAII